MQATLPVACGPGRQNAGPRAVPGGLRVAKRAIQVGTFAAERSKGDTLGKAQMDRTQPRATTNGRPAIDARRTKRDRHSSKSGRAAGDVRVVLDALPQPAFIVGIGDDEVCRFVHANARYRELFGLDLEHDLGGDLRAVLSADVLVPHITAFSRASREGGPVSFDVELENGRRSLSVEVVQMPEDWSDDRCLLGVVHDVSEYKRIEALLAHRVRHDPLTELPNRVMLLGTAHRHARGARARTTPHRVGLVLLDLDHFKIVNDSLGLSAGDELFAVVAQRVERVLRAGDTVARLGGDELAKS